MTQSPVTRRNLSASAAVAAGRVHEAELALHAARSAGVDAWVAAAYDHLHIAMLEYLAAIAASECRAVA